MGLIRKLNFFLGLRIKQIKEGIQVHQAKYAKEIIQRFRMKNFNANKSQVR